MNRPLSPDGEKGRSKSPTRKKGGESRPSSPPQGVTSPPTSPMRTPKVKKFSESDFENKRESIDPELRKKQLQAKIRGLKLEPKDWTRQELFEKMSNYFNIVFEGQQQSAKYNKETNEEIVPPSSPTKSTIVYEVSIINGVKIGLEDITVFNEFCRRNTEIKVINLANAGITDDYLKVILPGLKGIKLIKLLNLNSNYLTNVGLEDLIHHYGSGMGQPKQHRKRIETITLQGNLQLTYDNGYQFIQSFLGLDQICTISIGKIKQKEENLKIHSWDLSNQDIRLFELGMICFILKTYLTHIQEIILVNNQLNCKGFHYLLDTIRNSLRFVNTLDLSGSNITNNGFDMTGITKLLKFLQSTNQFHFVILENIPGITAELSEKIERSCAVNRSIFRKTTNGYFFNEFLKNRIQHRGVEKESVLQAKIKELSDWKPNREAVDEEFIKKNRLPICDLKFLYFDPDEEFKNEESDEEEEDEEEWSDMDTEDEEEAKEKLRKNKRKPLSKRQKEEEKQKQAEIQRRKALAEQKRIRKRERESQKSTFSTKSQSLNDPDADTTSLMSKVSFEGPSEPNTTDKIINGFTIRWLFPKTYDEHIGGENDFTEMEE
jgi:FtsZ-interacting cell division protein YlmF